MEVAETFVIWSQTFWTISRRNDRNRSREVLEGMVTPCLKKSLASSFAIADLMYEVAGFITTSSKEYAENDTFPLLRLVPLAPLYSLFLLFPLLWLSSLLALSVFPLFIIFCSLSQPGRSRLGRWTSWNDLAIASRCFLFFSFFLFTSTFLSLLFFLNPCNAGHSSWEAPAKNCAFCDTRSCTSVSRHEKLASAAYSGSPKYSDTYRHISRTYRMQYTEKEFIKSSCH